ncbi:VanZ family protein [Salinactinospora qingdaonensis]|uniref:VanZ-like domain-containing protein n=1 Tax=Salinactinospora qingdaonensis TaxID=702744 RepID=A0ABP7FGU5_9ACTN
MAKGKAGRAGDSTRTGARKARSPHEERGAASGKASPSASQKGDPGAADSPTTGERLRAFSFILLRAVVMLAAFVAMVSFAVFLAGLTLTPVPGAVGQTHVNLQPGWSLQLYLDFPARDALKQVGGNIVLGAPFGVLLPLIFPKLRGVFKITLLTAFVMLMVETAQGVVVLGRAFDIDDVILNTSGALLGYLLLGRRLSRALHLDPNPATAAKRDPATD